MSEKTTSTEEEAETERDRCGLVKEASDWTDDSAMVNVKRAKESFDHHRSEQEARGAEVCFVVVGYVSGREPFRLLGRVSADTGLDMMPDPELSPSDMQDVAFAAKMAFVHVLRHKTSGKSVVKPTTARTEAMTKALRPGGWKPSGSSEWKVGYLMISEDLMQDDGVAAEACLRATDAGKRWDRDWSHRKKGRRT